MRIRHITRKIVAGWLALSMLPLSACSVFENQQTTESPTQSETTSADSQKPQTPNQPADAESDPALEISELMVFNTMGVTDEDGNYCGWIELHNRKEQDVALAEYTLEYNGRTYALPAITLGGDGYQLIYANGKGSGLGASFTLGSSGMLTLRHGDLLTHTLSYVNRTVNHSFVVATGAETAQPTPGYGAVKEADRLIISEVMSNNSVTPIDGVLEDYIELYNDGTEPIDLSKCFISKKEEKLLDVRLDAKLLQPGEYCLLVRDKGLPFGLSKDGESIYITREDGVLLASVSFGAMSGGQVYLHERGIVEEPSPGYPNTREGMYAAICHRTGLVISEVIPSNGSYMRLNKEYYDIVELWNCSDAEINLGEYYFSDSKSELQRYQLPSVMLAPGAYYTFHCTGTAKIADTAPISISSEGEKIYLSKADGTVCDAWNLPAVPYNVSYGRGEKALYYYKKPSLGAANGIGYLSVADAPTVTLMPGTYSGVQKVSLQGEGTIYYTLDGTRPTTSANVYGGEIIEITATTAIRAFAVADGKISSAVVTYNYLIDLPDYELPVLKIAVNHDDMFGSDGIYTKYTSGREKECSATFFVDGKEEFSVNCGIKISGASSVKFDKKSFQLKFKAKYGNSKLKYKMFDNLDITEFDSLVVRSGSQGMMSYRLFFNDELVSSLAIQSNTMSDLLAQSYRPCNLYINDEYFGIYFIREKIDEDFIAAHTGVSPESVSIIQWPASLKTGSSDQGWKALYQFAISHDMTDEANYRKVADQICLESLVDMFVMRIWSSDRDSGNMRAYKSTEGDGKWRFILYDSDISMENITGQVGYMFVTTKQETRQKLVRSLIKNSEFRALMVERFEMHCSGTISPETTRARMDALEAELLHDMAYNIARWPGSKYPYHSSVGRWQSRVERAKNRYTTQEYLDSIKVQFVTQLHLTPDEVRKAFGEDYVQYCG